MITIYGYPEQLSIFLEKKLNIQNKLCLKDPNTTLNIMPGPIERKFQVFDIYKLIQIKLRKDCYM